MKRYLLVEVPRALLRLALAFGLYGIVTAIPWPQETGHWIGVTAFALLAASIVVICGKLLYDTLYPVQGHHSRTQYFYPRPRR